MDFRNMTVKEILDDPKTAAVIKRLAPTLSNYPIRLFNNRPCGEVIDMAIRKNILPKDAAQRLEQELNKVI